MGVTIRNNRAKWFLFYVLVAITAVVVVGVGIKLTEGQSNGGPKLAFTIEGTMSLVSDDLSERYLDALVQAEGDYSNVDCSSGLPGTGYSHIHSGVQVVVANESGTTVGTTTLGPGHLFYEGPINAVTACRFPFVVRVPRAAFYKMSVAGRGDTTSSFEELVADGWQVELLVGSPGP